MYIKPRGFALFLGTYSKHILLKRPTLSYGDFLLLYFNFSNLLLSAVIKMTDDHGRCNYSSNNYNIYYNASISTPL